MIEDGDTGVIGGIYTRNMANSARVPGPSKLPLLGYLFRNNFGDERRSC